MAEQNLEQSLFLHAIALASPAQRAQYLDESCRDNLRLRAELEALLAAHDRLGAASTLRTAPAATDTSIPPTDLGAVIGPYKLLEQIGEGGMGTVWMAQQSKPVKRQVAVKLIKPGMDSRQVIARFEAERQALALMDHPNIARVLDAGTTNSGRPYFVMDLVRGTPITSYCDERHLTPRQRLELFLPVCHAVQHAHQKGVIHRDLKPSNVLVALYDGKAVPKVIDFGVAKATGTPLTEQTLVTGLGNVVGTLEYMSPEQAELNQLDIDTRSDIYSLGVLLYELLTGGPPFTRKELEQAGMLEMLRVIREQEPSKPSTKLSTAEGLAGLAANRGTEPAKLTKLVRGELDWIVMKALEKDRNRRYETASGFAMDIQHYLADEPVIACPPSATYRLRKFVRRNKTAVLAVVAILFVLVAGIAGTTFGLIRAEHRRAEADLARSNEAEQRRIAEEQERKAKRAEADTLDDYRASTDDAIEHLIGSKPDLGPQERLYLEKTLSRWESFAARSGDDQRNQAIRAEGQYRVALVLQRLGRLDEAKTKYEKARELFKKLVRAFPTVTQYHVYLSNTHENLGQLLHDLREGEAARVEFNASREMLEKLTAAFPGVPAYQDQLANNRRQLGQLLHDLGELDAAHMEFDAAHDLLERLVADFPAIPQYQSSLAATHTSLGVLLWDLGQYEAAQTEHKAARELLKKLTAAFPTTIKYQEGLAVTQMNLGAELDELGERKAARAEYEAAREVQKKLVAAYPAVPFYQRQLAACQFNLAILLSEADQPDAACAEYKSVRDLQKKLVIDFPTVPTYQRDLASTQTHLASLLGKLGQSDAARTEFEAARDLQTKLVAAYPDVPEYQVDLGMNYHNAAIVINDEGKFEESLHWFDLAIRTLTPIYEHDHRNDAAKKTLGRSHSRRAWTYDRLGKRAEALEDWDRAVELNPVAEQPTLRAFRATSLLRAGRVAEAVAEVEDLTKESKWSAVECYEFACIYAVACAKIVDQKQRYGDRALELLQRAVQTGYSNVAFMANDADLDALRDREDFQKVLAALKTNGN